MTHGALPPRTYLFVPATRLDRLGSAWASGCDAVIVDLEDAVAEADKDAARTALLAADIDRPVHVRVNGVDTPHHGRDLDALREMPALAGVMLPKVEETGDAAQVLDALGRTVDLLALVETPLGVLRAPELAAAPGVARLAFGAVDLGASLGLTPTPQLMHHPRAVLALASAAAGLPSPVDAPHLRLDDDEGLRRHVEDARELGFGGHLCVHPRQVAVLTELLAPAADVAAARELLAEAANHQGAFRWQGEMVDEPVLTRARQLLTAHGVAD